MILEEATIGGTLYLDWVPGEMALPESERVAFDYGPISNKVRIDLIHRTCNESGVPNGAEVCKAAIDGNGKKIRNLKGANGEALDTVEKLLKYSDKDLSIAYMLEVQGLTIWRKQNGEGILKN